MQPVPVRPAAATESAPGADSQPLETLALPAGASELGAAETKAFPSLPVISGYELHGELGRGGMGVVYKARDRALHRTVAIKMMRSGSDANREELERFRAEAQAVAALQHPHIVQLHEIGQHAQGPFIVFEFVEGKSLDHVLKTRKLTPQEAAKLAETLARAVHFAHEKHIVHRDLKPANVLLAMDGTAKLTDFGLAKRLGSQETGLTRTGAIMGTPAYMAPEQAQGDAKQVGPGADIYALGVILYEMLAGRPPFVDATPMGMIYKVLYEEPASPSRIIAEVPRDLETICMKCLAKHVPDRYSSALALAQDLERHLAGEPILARRESALRWAWRKAKKRAMPLTLTILAATAVLAAVWSLREMAKARGIESLAREVETRFGDLETDSKRDETEIKVQLLAEQDAVRGEAARRKLLDQVGEGVRHTLRQPRVSAEDARKAEGAIAWLQARDPESARALRESLARRVREWQMIGDLNPPFADADKHFRSDEILAEQNGLRRKPGTGRTVATLWPSIGALRMTAVFGGDWESGKEAGIVIHHKPQISPGAGGYEITVIPAIHKGIAEDRGPSAEVALDFRSSERQAELRITRNGGILSRSEIRIPVGPLQIIAERDGDRLRAQVNDLPPVVFLDPVPMTGDAGSVLGLIWPDQAALRRMQVETSILPPAASPLEKADQHFDRNQFAEALSIYAAPAPNEDVAAEAMCKAGLCLLALNRPEEAVRTLESAMTKKGDRWPVVAAAQLWLTRLRSKQYAEADNVYAAVSVRFTPEQMALYVPSQVREELVTGEPTAQVNYLLPDSKVIPRYEALIRLADLLKTKQAFRSRLNLARAYSLQREFAKALPFAEKVVRDVIDDTVFANGPNEAVYWAVRWNGWIRRSIGNGRDAIDAVRRYRQEVMARPASLPAHQADRQRTAAPLRLEAARYLAQVGDWKEAEDEVDAFFDEMPRPIGNYTFYAQPFLLKGFFASKAGDEAKAQEYWKQGLYVAFQKQLGDAASKDRLPFGAWNMIDYWMLASLTDSLSDSEADALQSKLFDRLTSDPLLSQLSSGLRISPAVFRNVWRTPRGRKLAKQVAFFEMEPVEHFRTPPLMLVYEKFRTDLFDGKPTADQDEVCWQAPLHLVESMSSGTIGPPQALQLILAWKGTYGNLGWSGAASRLPDELRGPAAYLMGIRYLKLGRPAEAADMFRMSAKTARAEGPIRTLAEQELKKLTLTP